MKAIKDMTDTEETEAAGITADGKATGGSGEGKGKAAGKQKRLNLVLSAGQWELLKANAAAARLTVPKYVKATALGAPLMTATDWTNYEAFKACATDLRRIHGSYREMIQWVKKGKFVTDEPNINHLWEFDRKIQKTVAELCKAFEEFIRQSGERATHRRKPGGDDDYQDQQSAIRQG